MKKTLLLAALPLTMGIDFSKGRDKSVLTEVNSAEFDKMISELNAKSTGPKECKCLYCDSCLGVKKQ